MLVAAKVAAPILLTALLVGFLISLFQAATQIQEPTLSFVPKMIAVAIALLVTGNWVLSELISFTQRDRKSTRLNSSHANISYAVFCLKKKKIQELGYY